MLPTATQNLLSLQYCVEVIPAMIVELGEKLKQLRTEKHLRQDQVACLINVERSSISLWENDLRQPTYTALVKLATLYGVTTDYLLGCSNHRTVDISGLTAAEAAMISDLVASMTAKNKKLEELRK
ncbi:MAG: helix-turn-helix transcriptional regulator [Lachnospiraceae bacterium]|nr:helix-turn-helix transcriptional regulator [Lachnospiraceae bacterium]